MVQISEKEKMIFKLAGKIFISQFRQIQIWKPGHKTDEGEFMNINKLEDFSINCAENIFSKIVLNTNE